MIQQTSTSYTFRMLTEQPRESEFFEKSVCKIFKAFSLEVRNRIRIRQPQNTPN